MKSNLKCKKITLVCVREEGVFSCREPLTLEIKHLHYLRVLDGPAYAVI